MTSQNRNRAATLEINIFRDDNIRTDSTKTSELLETRTQSYKSNHLSKFIIDLNESQESVFQEVIINTVISSFAASSDSSAKSPDYTASMFVEPQS